MKVKWRTHELILVTVIFTVLILAYCWRQFSPEQQAFNARQAELFSAHQLVFDRLSNQLLPQAGLMVVTYLAYLWVTLLALPWFRKLRGYVRKALGLLAVFTVLALVHSAAFIGSVYLKEEWRYHYPGFSIFYRGYNSHQNIALNGIMPILFLSALFVAYLALREVLIRYLEQPGAKRHYRVMLANQVTTMAGAYLLFILLVQLTIRVTFYDLFTRLYLIPLPAVGLGFTGIYYFFPTYSGRPLFWRLTLWSFLLALPVPFLIDGSPLIIFPLAWLFGLLVVIPMSWWLYRQQKDHILAFRGMEKDLSKSNADLQFLRSQINPHFLFNTLNTIYASALDEEAKRTAKCLQMLGDMMRFMLDENMADHIPLQKEINYIKNYVALQQLRLPLSDKMVIDLLISSDDEDHRIAPMLMIPLIENAFKYGISMQEPTHIHIDLSVDKGILKLEVRNSIHYNKTTEGENAPSGIGLSNIRSRLELIYPGSYQFSTGQADGQYIAQLAINLQTQ